MDDSEVAYDFSDSEMLDDASEEGWYASPASPLQVAHVVNGDVPSGDLRRIELGTTAVNRDMGQPVPILNNHPASSHVDSPAHLSRASEQDVLKDEVGVQSTVLTKIEGIFEAMVDVLLNERDQLSVAIKTRPLSRGQPRDMTSAAQTPAESVQHLRFPGKTEKEAWRFGEHRMRSSCRRHDTDTA